MVTTLIMMIMINIVILINSNNNNNNNNNKNKNNNNNISATSMRPGRRRDRPSMHAPCRGTWHSQRGHAVSA